jgi:hypothetical protein
VRGAHSGSGGKAEQQAPHVLLTRSIKHIDLASFFRYSQFYNITNQLKFIANPFEKRKLFHHDILFCFSVKIEYFICIADLEYLLKSFIDKNRQPCIIQGEKNQ